MKDCRRSSAASYMKRSADRTWTSMRFGMRHGRSRDFIQTSRRTVNIRDMLLRLSNLHCWHVSCRGAVGPSFQLALGAKIARAIPLKNSKQPAEFRDSEGE